MITPRMSSTNRLWLYGEWKGVQAATPAASAPHVSQQAATTGTTTMTPTMTPSRVDFPIEIERSSAGPGQAVSSFNGPDPRVSFGPLNPEKLMVNLRLLIEGRQQR
jgi:hypothetical protein